MRRQGINYCRIAFAYLAFIIPVTVALAVSEREKLCGGAVVTDLVKCRRLCKRREAARPPVDASRKS